MNLYKVLIVDDEEEIRHGIIKKIDWEKYGFTVVGDAENGKDAIDKVEKFQPDIIMTDIKMPFMDGLELGEYVYKESPSTKIIIFSGSDDLEYAHKAIKINVVEYVLKPINSIELIEVLKKLKNTMDEEYNEKKNFEKLNKYYLESLPIMKEKFLVGTIEGRIEGSSWVQAGKKVGVEFDFPYFAIGVLYNDKLIDSSEHKENDFVDISIKQIVDETLVSYCKAISFIYSGKVIIIGNLDNKDGIINLINGLNEVCKSCERVLGQKVSAGIGQIVREYEGIRFSYKMARNALHYRMVLGTGKAIYIEDVEPDNSVQLQFDENDERELLNVIKLKSDEEIKDSISNLFCRIEKLLLPFNKYKIYFIEITTSLLKVVQAYDINMEEIFGEGFNCYSHLDDFNSINQAKEWFIEKSVRINNLIKRERMDSSKLLIEKAKEYINQNYSNTELSVEVICSQLHVSPTYFSTLFKKETGSNFINYLTSTRLNEAVNLLNTTDYKSYMIAEKVGYTEANYFSYVFKKKFGVSPSRYRNVK
ncbi:response regulator [Clostridium paraputrificum]|uniref:response regulator n=1 Tax=Clostridium paraputrificum TaxID=29363 RepID=UPI0018A0FA63|nr:response regulator [Clostridium paraputrificum]